MIDWLLDVLGLLASAARTVWPGVLCSAALGWVGATAFGSYGFALGAALGALVGTYAGARLELTPQHAATGSRPVSFLLRAGGAFLITGIGYVVLQFAMIIAALALIIAVGLTWILS